MVLTCFGPCNKGLGLKEMMFEIQGGLGVRGCISEKTDASTLRTSEYPHLEVGRLMAYGLVILILLLLLSIIIRLMGAHQRLSLKALMA